jgi:hypothetical protein
LLLTAFLIPPLVAHTCRREAAALAVRRRIRGLLQPHVAANPWGVLDRRTSRRSDTASGLLGEQTCHDHRCSCVIDPLQTSSQVAPTQCLLRIVLETPAVLWE